MLRRAIRRVSWVRVRRPRTVVVHWDFGDFTSSVPCIEATKRGNDHVHLEVQVDAQITDRHVSVQSEFPFRMVCDRIQLQCNL